MTARHVVDMIRPYVDRGDLPGAVVGVWQDGECRWILPVPRRSLVAVRYASIP